MGPLLCVGGPIDGQYRTVEPGATQWREPLPEYAGGGIAVSRYAVYEVAHLRDTDGQLVPCLRYVEPG